MSGSRLQVVRAATVICVRHTARPSYVQRKDLISPQTGEVPPFIEQFLGGEESVELTSGWEVLMGQSEIWNYMRSSQEKLRTMAYAGEWKIFGGTPEAGESLEEAAVRELSEECSAPALLEEKCVSLIPFCVKQTRPVRNRSHLMFNFCCLAETNDWLRNFDVEAANTRLANRRVRHEEALGDGSFWNLREDERHMLSPEVHELRWMSLGTALTLCLSSMVPGLFANEYQRKTFDEVSRYRGQLKTRDPMYMTAVTLLQLEAFSNPADILAYRNVVRGDLEALARREQWLFDGMTSEQVMEAFAGRSGMPRSWRDRISILQGIDAAHLTSRL